MDGNKKIGHQLHAHAVTKPANIVDGTGEALENWRESFDPLGIPAGIYSEVARDGLRASTRKWAV